MPSDAAMRAWWRQDVDQAWQATRELSRDRRLIAIVQLAVAVGFSGLAGLWVVLSAGVWRLLWTVLLAVVLLTVALRVALLLGVGRDDAPRWFRVFWRLHPVRLFNTLRSRMTSA